MKVVLSTIGKFHTFALACELERRKALTAIFTGYPKFKLKNEGLPQQKLRSFPTLYQMSVRLGMNNPWMTRELQWWSLQAFDTYVSKNLPDGDIFCGLSGSASETGKTAKSHGLAYVCDRGSSHIRYQNRILEEEYALQGKPFQGIDPRLIAKEEAEYQLADAIAVPSQFAKRSFIKMGISEKKLHLVPYGVNLKLFHPVTSPDSNFFDVLFVGSASLRKGVPYLLQAFSQLQHPNKRLKIVGIVQPELASSIERAASKYNIVTTGHIPQPQLKSVMSRSHVMVLPSVEEGLALVQAQALACGCPVIATTNTGAEDLFTDGVEGFIVPIRNPEAIAERMQLLADRPDLQQQMSVAALERVKRLGGWASYGTAMFELFSRLS